MTNSKSLMGMFLALGDAAFVADTTNGIGITAAAYDRHGTVEIIRNGRSQTILYDVVNGKAQNSLSEELLRWVNAGNKIRPFDTTLLLQEQWQVLRSRRNAALAETDWTQMPDAPVDQAAWAAYRQALRDMTNDLADPLQAVWPDRP